MSHLQVVHAHTGRLLTCLLRCPPSAFLQTSLPNSALPAKHALQCLRPVLKRYMFFCFCCVLVVPGHCSTLLRVHDILIPRSLCFSGRIYHTHVPIPFLIGCFLSLVQRAQQPWYVSREWKHSLSLVTMVTCTSHALVTTLSTFFTRGTCRCSLGGSPFSEVTMSTFCPSFGIIASSCPVQHDPLPPSHARAVSFFSCPH